MSFSSIGLALQIVIALFGAFFLAFWISLIVWTFRDVRSRSRDIFAQLLATLMVIIFNVPGLILYFMLRPQETLAEKYERALEEEALLQDIEERYNCPACKQRIKPDYQFCPACHAQLKQVCSSCGKLLQLHWDLCPFCGTTAVPQSDVFKSRPVGKKPVVGRQPIVSKLSPRPRATAPELTQQDTVRLKDISNPGPASSDPREVAHPMAERSVLPTEPFPVTSVVEEDLTAEESPSVRSEDV